MIHEQSKDNERHRDASPALNTSLRHIVCPQEASAVAPSLFFAGGISNCPDWQGDFAAMLIDQDLTAFNPRRPDFPINDPSASDGQIRWEHKYLKTSSAVSFWFPKETVCPITLYELGTYTFRDTQLFIGIHPEYERAAELIAFTSIHRPGLKIVRSLQELADQVKLWVADPSVPAAQAPFASLQPVLPDSLFIAGGIKGCPDWQTGFCESIRDAGLTVHNPRRADFSIDSVLGYAASLRGTHETLMKSETIAFWFPKESINPVVLYELGIASMTGKKLFVGVDPGYFRQDDVRIQTGLVRDDVSIVYSLDDLAAQVIAWKRGK